MDLFGKETVARLEFKRGLAGLRLKDATLEPGDALNLAGLGLAYDGVRVQTRRPLARSTDFALTCAAYTASDYIEGFALDGLEAADVAAVYVHNNNGKFEIEYRLDDSCPARDGRPFIPASSWPLTPAVFTPQASFVVGLRGRRGAEAPPAGLIVYDVYAKPECYDAILRGPAPAQAVVGAGGHRLAVGENGYDLLDGRGIRVNQF